MKAIIYTIKLLEPVLVTALEGDPNSSVSFPYLPGSVLRGVFVGRYLRHIKKQQLDAGNSDETNTELRRLFFTGETCYLNGCLDCGKYEPQRTLPAPRSWYREKDADLDQVVDLYDLAHPLSVSEDLKAIGNLFCSVGTNHPLLLKPQRQLAVHTARNRRFGRARSSSGENELSGAVFQYESLAPGQSFVAVILCQNEDETLLMSLIDGKAQIGGSRTGGYGRVQLTHIKTEEATSWQETSIKPNAANNKVIVTLLSDLILRDSYGQPTNDPQQVAIALGGELQDAYLSTHVVSGFNRKWGLPLPQIPAYAMGSLFILDKVDQSKLDKALQCGLGERRAEGFGRLGLHWNQSAQLRGRVWEAQEPDMPAFTDPTSQKLAQQMANRLLSQKLDWHIGSRAFDLIPKDYKSKVSKSQVYRLRALLEDILRELAQAPREKKAAVITKGRERIQEYLDNVMRRDFSRKQFEKARLDNKQFLDWAKERVADTQEESTREAAIGPMDLPKIGQISAEWDDETTFSSNLRLISGVLAHMAKSAREDN
ncbi:MAG: hypothetical protein KC418_21930 [Anaerolineales bacterium]|nr:hypothetical protein [Anaerolineales bacterium]